jgi:peptide/nickel transport system ATP-binding protein
MVLRHGAVVETAQTRAMLRAPREAYTRSLWAVRHLDKPAASPAGPLLRLSGVHASYGQRRVLHDIELEFPRRHTVAVVGESGSGKSTLARVIAGILPPTSGRVALNGTELAGSFRQRSARELRRIQLVHQSPDTALNPRHTVREILGRPLALFDRLRGRVLEQRVLELLDMVGLDRKYMQRRPGELSGGEKQRIAISRALAASPEVILCDEITSALDQIVQREVIDLLLALQRRLDITYVFITHDFATVRAIADEVVVMHRGRIVEKGSKRQVLSPPHEPYTELLLSSVPEMDSTWLDGILARRRADSEAHRTSLV